MQELIMTIDVALIDVLTVKGHIKEIVMIPFTAKAYGEYFVGETIGQSVDTQTILPGKAPHLSARYMLEGHDFKGTPCKVFIQNESWEDGFKPMIVTDSENLAFLETKDLWDTVEGIPGGVRIQVYCER